MQIKLEKSDRRLLMWAGVILLPLIVILVLFSENDEDTHIPTTYSSTSSGAKAAYLFLKEEGYNVERWESPPNKLPQAARNTVLVLASPQGMPDDLEKIALQRYLKRGGRILGTGFSCSWFLPETDITPEIVPDPVGKEYQPQIISPLARAGTIKMSVAAHWDQAATNQLLHYADDGKGIIVSYPVGEGEIIWWGASQPLSNAGINQAGNLSLLLNSLGGSRSTRILWDEYFHSQHLTHAAAAWTPPLKYGFWQCLLVFVTLVLTFGRRNAPLRPLREPSRLSPLEFVQTLGNLYRRANATRTALEVPYNRFRALLIRRLGLRNDVSSSELLESARKKLAYRDPEFEDTLRQVLNGLHDPEIKEPKVLELVQRLNRHARDLKLISMNEEE